LVLFAAIALLFTARYPRGIYDIVLGMNRWALRVAAYVWLMTDTYPPFRLDLGGTDPTPPPTPHDGLSGTDQHPRTPTSVPENGTGG
ncbi:MAG: DUF4389 domain-containing protein, partial [Pseudonocardiaceae bacterium]